MLDTSNQPPSIKIPLIIPSLISKIENNDLKDWNSNENLKLLNLHYDVTPSQFITVVSCDIGFLSPQTIVSVLRDLKRFC